MNQEIDLQRILHNFKQRIVLVALIAFLTCVLVSSYVLFLQKPYYKATSTLVLTGVSSKNSTSDGITTNDLSINKTIISPKDTEIFPPPDIPSKEDTYPS